MITKSMKTNLLSTHYILKKIQKVSKLYLIPEKKSAIFAL